MRAAELGLESGQFGYLVSFKNDLGIPCTMKVNFAATQTIADLRSHKQVWDSRRKKVGLVMLDATGRLFVKKGSKQTSDRTSTWPMMHEKPLSAVSPPASPVCTE